VDVRRGRRKTVCARVADRALAGGRSASPLGVVHGLRFAARRDFDLIVTVWDHGACTFGSSRSRMPNSIAAGSGIREIARLRKRYGRGRWRKRNGVAEIELPSGEIVSAELHWYEATGIGRREYKIKGLL
jgi:hypothetical protein